MTTTGQVGGLLGKLSEELAGAVDRASQSIVTIHGRRRMSASGIAWPDNGIVVTADHVLEREEDIAVTLPDGQRAAAQLVGRDPGSDVAVLKIPGVTLTPAGIAPIGLKVGHFVLAVGRPGGNTMASFGVVSAIGGAWRTARGGVIDGYIRADVTLYPGFSGAPLVDAQGKVVGLLSSHLAGGQAAAIPAPTLSGIVQTLLSSGRVRRAYLGITSQA